LGSRMKTLLVSAAILMASHGPLDNGDWGWTKPYPEFDNLCKSFVEWQRAMKRDGYPEDTYMGTGMEKHCPGMV